MDIVQSDNASLRMVSKKIEDLNMVSSIIATILEALGKDRKSGQLGIAAPQIGSSIRIFGFWYGNQKIVVVNPEIILSGREFKSIEGCLSIARGNQKYIVIRNKFVKLRGLDANGKLISLKLNGLDAAVVQHETDHLDGIMIDQKGIVLP